MSDIQESLESPFLSAEFEGIEREASRSAAYFMVVDERGAPLSEGDYALHQGSVSERGSLAAGGRVPLGKIDVKRPFSFEISDRVCLIEHGAYFDPDDPKLEYGGTRFDWRRVRDDQAPGKSFWPEYRAALQESALPFAVNRLLQHEHITRRPIQIAKEFLAALDKVKIRACPAEVRVGPFVRYTDHERAVIWLETVTPCMARVYYKRAGGNLTSRFASTIRVGGRYFASVELDGLQAGQFYDYSVELAPLPGTGPVPLAQADFATAFPRLKPGVQKSIRTQLKSASLDKSEWLAFRTLLPLYGKFTFATGSCRWYPGDDKLDKKTKKPENAGPDMLDGLGAWLRGTAREKWPHFCFFSGDQIYADECGENQAERLIEGRFAARVPGPVDTRSSRRDQLIDGAWAGRFAHRMQPYKDPDPQFAKRVNDALKRLDEIHDKYPDIKGIRKEYPEDDPTLKLKWRYELIKGKRQVSGAKLEADDERHLREAVAHLDVVKGLEVSTEPFRVVARHWKAAEGLRKQPMRKSFLNYNFLLWQLPNFSKELPTISHTGGPAVVRAPDARGHASAERGVHSADFAEYASLYERAWTSSPNVRALLAHVPTFLMFDDHELTDDWNFDVDWAHMLHNPKDDYRMWPKTLTDALAAYWVYQGYGNKAPSQWDGADPRVKALREAQKLGSDALPALRRCIYDACFDPKYLKQDRHQSGLTLDWHYRLPFEPAFIVPDCRSRKLMYRSDEAIDVIDHGVKSQAPISQTIDDPQLDWIRRELAKKSRVGQVAFLATATPFLLQQKVAAIMRAPKTAAGAWARGNSFPPLADLAVALADSNSLANVSPGLARRFRREKDLEHMVRDKTWRDLWSVVAQLNAAKSPLKSLVFVSGDVHHSYCMTGSLGRARPQPEVLQITCSGFRTTIRAKGMTDLAEDLGSSPFDAGKYRLMPGFMDKNGDLKPDLVLYENSAALVDVTVGKEVFVRVEFLSGKNKHVYRYTSGPEYMVGPQPAFSPYTPGVRRVVRAP
jgi:hypothetical protein